MLINQQNLQAIYTGFKTIFNKTISEANVQYPQIAMEVPSSTSDENYAWFGGLPSMREWVGDRVIQNLSAHTYNIKNKDYELTVSVGRNDIADDRIGIYKPLIQDMAENAKRHPDELVFELLGSGFTQKCYDGKAFFATDHPFVKNQVQSNKGTKKLSSTTYGEARAHMMTIKGENNKSLKIVPDLLIVSPQNEAVAREILMANEISGTTNIFKGTAELLVVPELVDNPDYWFLASTKRAIKPLVFQVRQKPNFVSMTNDTDENVFYRKEYVYGVDARYNAGFGLWQLAYGSTGETA